MNLAVIAGKWNIYKGRCMQKIAFLADNLLLFNEGRKQEMFGEFQVKMAREKRASIKA